MGKPGKLPSLHRLQVPKSDAVTVLAAVSWNKSRGRSSELSVGMKVALLLPLPSPFHYMAKGGGNSQQHLAQALQQCGGPSEELPEGQRRGNQMARRKPELRAGGFLHKGGLTGSGGEGITGLQL